ncbi:hypothetical protein K443DRAFT_134429 [Laccaria amethystina LaAM-08-1]|uniref:Uncharacterized protein n=1 Tax=Laccaria amethystina LaAM-08-1 TaxID=1095629 RepID=A0A0C9WJX5_9AGAR|nr:hypothetical protein K443DRAFT_134429 [Laccaria amethystina LaAM-08-1]
MSWECQSTWLEFYKSPQTRLDVSCLLTTAFPLWFFPTIRTRGLPQLPPLLDIDGVQVPSARTLPVRSSAPPICHIAFGGSSSTRPHSTIALDRSHSLTVRSVLTLYSRNSVLATRVGGEETTRTNGRIKKVTRTNDEALDPTKAMLHQLGA